jgi:UDP:flavonoid glycosyltransferase YjiC (YdhE family)
LVALNRALVDPEGLFPASHRFTGFWRNVRARAPSPPGDLAEFVEAGPPPVVVTLGSMATVDPAPLLRTVEAALLRAGMRGVVIGGYTDVCGFPVSSPALRCAKEAPYDWLLPRAACVVHHGGSGTVEAVLRAGKVSVLLPQVRAQEVFGDILSSAGVVAAVLESDSLSSERLAGALRRASDDPALAARARDWQRVITDEDGGTRRAVDWIEEHAARTPRGGARI